MNQLNKVTADELTSDFFGNQSGALEPTQRVVACTDKKSALSAETQAAYRFLGNERIGWKDIRIRTFAVPRHACGNIQSICACKTPRHHRA